MVNHRAFKNHMCIPFGKSLSLAPRSRSSVKIKYHFSKNGLNGGLNVSQTQLVQSAFYEFPDRLSKVNITYIKVSYLKCKT